MRGEGKEGRRGKGEEGEEGPGREGKEGPKPIQRVKGKKSEAVT